MRHRSGTLLAGLLALPIALTQGALAQAPTMDQLYAAAKAEGAVDFGGALKEDAAQELLQAFSKKYPGIKVSYTRRSTEPMVQLIEADRLANKVSFDLINLTEPADMVRYKTEGFVQPVPLPDRDILLTGTFDPDNFYYALGITPMYGIYNTQNLKKADAPTSLKALVTDPKWIGKVAISRPSRGGTGAAALLNVVDAVGPDFLKTVKERDILLTRGNEAAVSSVISGERPVSWGVSGYRALEAKAGGSPIELIYWDEGTAVAQFMAAVPTKANHPNAGKLLLRWLMSKEGQELHVKVADFYSPRKDVEVSPRNEPPLSKLKINLFGNDRLLKAGQELSADFDKAVGLK
jgi:iron(III) transport system substrate-binding protein